MPFLRQLGIYCWILQFSLLTICATSENKEATIDYKTKVVGVFRKVTYEFNENPKTWLQAEEECAMRGGELLMFMDSESRDFLLNLSQGLVDAAWWVGEGFVGLNNHSSGYDINDALVQSNGDRTRPCTYVMKDSFESVTTPNCNMTLGYLCTLDLLSETEKVRWRRDVDSTNITTDLQSMTSKTDLSGVLQIARDILSRLELELETISHGGKMKYLDKILQALPSGDVKNNVNNRNLTENCASAILLFSTEMCDTSETPSQIEQLIIGVAKIFSEIKFLMDGSATYNQEFITGTLYATKQELQGLGNLALGAEGDTTVSMPSLSAMQSQLSSGPIGVQLFSFNVNPLSSESNYSITGTVCSLSLSKSDGSPVNLKNLPEYIEIFLPRPEAEEPTITNITMKKGFSIYTSFNISDVNSTVIISAVPDPNVSLQLSLYNSNPQTSKNASTANVTLKAVYRWIIHPEMMRGLNGTWYVNITALNYSTSQSVNIQLSILNFKCVYWDEVMTEWGSDGCVVGPKTTPWMTHCLCNHNTFYGSSFFVMPNKVDLSRTVELFATVKENYVVVVVLSVFFFLFLIVLSWAWYADRRALRTRKITLLDDNHPCAHYNYLLNVQTGNRKGAGTTAKVMMTLEGSDGESETHLLSDPDQPVFEKGGVDMFMVSTAYPLGDLQSIKLWHDNTGGHPDWFLQKVTVKDCQTKQIWHFLCSTWLTASGDAPCKRTFNPAKKNEISSFGHIFQARTSTGFRDEHIWMSIVDPPRHSPFTRVQRVACCMSLLLCTMAINIMFWNIPNDSESPVIIKIASFSLTWQQIMVAVESALLMFPINILIVTIFRSIKPRIPHKEMFKSQTNIQPPAATMQTILKNSQDIINILSKGTKNRVMAMQQNPETTADLFAALNQMHDLLTNMLGQSDGDQHWAHCSRFVYYSLSHLSQLFDRAGEKVFSHPEDLNLAKNTVSMMLKKAETVTSSNPIVSLAPPPEEQKKNKPGCKLPWWFVFIGWGLLVSISGISTFFTLLYGFQYGKESSIKWVITLTLSLFQSIFVIQPLKIVGLAIFFALVLRPVAVDDSEEVEILLDEQREKCETFTGRQML